MASILQSTNKRRERTHHSLTSEHRAWKAMIQRCTNPNVKCYKNYGGRSISITERWINEDGFENFILDIDWKPAENYTLNRIDNEKNYTADNCEWTTSQNQIFNRRKLCTNTTGYIGVQPYQHDRTKYQVKIKIGDRRTYLGCFDDPEQAALEYDKAVIFFRGNDGVTNFL